MVNISLFKGVFSSTECSQTCRLPAKGTKVSKSGDSSSMARRTREEKFSESFLDSRRVGPDGPVLGESSHLVQGGPYQL